MKFRSVAWTVIILALVTAALYSMQQFQYVGRNTWLSKVQIAGQGGSDEAFVKRILGEPSRVMTPKEVYARHSFLPVVTPVPEAERVYAYIHATPNPFTIAYIFLDRTGKVLKIHIAISS